MSYSMVSQPLSLRSRRLPRLPHSSHRLPFHSPVCCRHSRTLSPRTAGLLWLITQKSFVSLSYSFCRSIWFSRSIRSSRCGFHFPLHHFHPRNQAWHHQRCVLVRWFRHFHLLHLAATRAVCKRFQYEAVYKPSFLAFLSYL